MLALFLFALSLQTQRIVVVATDISLENVLSINETCKGQELCGSSRHTADIRSAKCVCKEDCKLYGDCCRDSPWFTINTDPNSNPYKCFSDWSAMYSYYMIAKCPPGTDPVLSQLCQNEAPSSDPITNNVPLTVMYPDGRNLTYVNSNCARCNKAPLSLGHMWTPVVTCSNFAPKMNVNGSDLRWDEEAKIWTVLHGKEVHKCVISWAISQSVVNSVRMCRGQVVDTCEEEFHGSDEEKLCRSYTAILYHENTQYKNVYCAKCNNKIVNASSCTSVGFRAFSPGAAFTLLLQDPEKDSICRSKNEIYDAVFDKCRNITCPPGQKDCSGTRDYTVPRGLNETQIDSCKRVALERDVFNISNDRRSVWVDKYQRNFTEGQFRETEAGQVEICIGDIPRTFDKYSAILSIMTLVGLGLSIFFLLLHLLAVMLVSELRNHSGMNLASLSVALLGAHSSFIAGGFLQSASQRSCSSAAILIYFFFMAAFFWMLVLAYDVWRVLRGAVKHFRSATGKQWCRFTIYSLFAWGVPIVLTGIALLVETAPAGKINEKFRPRFGEDSCWFSRRLPLMVFFALPLAVIMILNVTFFTLSALMAAGSRMKSASSNVSTHRKDFRLCLRLAILLGMTWVVGLLAAALNYEVLWIGFILLNTLQGVFIFAVFTCTSKVIDHLTKPYPWTNGLRRSLRLAPAKPIALMPSDITQSTSDSILKSSTTTTTAELVQDIPSPSAPRRPSAQLGLPGTPRRPSS